jgi:hypothetical protein
VNAARARRRRAIGLMREMNWTWADLRATPLPIVREIERWMAEGWPWWPKASGDEEPIEWFDGGE